MLGFFKKEKFLTAPVCGEVIEISKVHDEVFSQKILGDGFAVIPEDGNIYSPADGTVTDVTKTNHAYCITSDDGLEILVHIGIDTVELKGSGFTPLVKNGDSIRRGTPLARVDLNLIKERGYRTDVITVITNTDAMKEFSVLEMPHADVNTNIFSYKL